VRVTIPGKQIRSAIKAATGVSKDNEDRQILRNVLIEATDEGLEITATDTIVGLWLKLPVDDTLVVKKKGRMAVNTAQLLRVLDTIANRTVTLSCTPRTCTVTAEGSRFRLNIEDANDFPKIARFSSRKPFITVPGDLIHKMMSRTAFCAHDEESFQLMHGLLVVAKEKELRMVATNGQRLAIVTAPFETQSHPDDPFEGDLVVQAELAQAVKKIVDNDVKTIDVQFMASFLNFRTERGEVSLRALAGNFPPYGMGIPSDLQKLKLDRRDFVEILKQATALKGPTTSFVSLTFDADKMTFHSVAEGAGESEIEYDFEWKDDPLQLTINPDFMLQTLASIRGDDVDLEVGSVMTPTILREQELSEGIKSFCVFAVVRQ